MTPKYIEHYAWCLEHLVGYEQSDTALETASDVVDALTGIIWNEEDGERILEHMERIMA